MQDRKQCRRVLPPAKKGETPHRCSRNTAGPLTDYCWQHGGRTRTPRPVLEDQVERELAKLGVFRRAAQRHLGAS